jgi:PST family polysaccharide transporter
LLALVAYPFAQIVGQTEHVWAFFAISALPIISSFRHRDVARYQRQLRFGPAVATEMTADLVCLALAIPLALWLRDYRVYLVLALLRAVVDVGLTHYWAEYPYRLAWDPQIARRAMNFGWPLAINNILLYVTLQGDRLLVASQFGPAVMGDYSVAVALTMQPAMLLMSVVSSLLMPFFASRKHQRDALLVAYNRSVNQQLWIALAAGVAWVTCASLVVTTLYGAKYQSAAIIVAWLGAAQSFRLLRGLPAILGIAMGDTKLSLYSNFLRAIAFLVLWFFVLPQSSAAYMAVAVFLSELLTGVATSVLLQMRHQVPAGRQIVLMLALASAIGLAFWFCQQLPHFVPGHWGPWVEATVACLAIGAAGAATIHTLGWRRMRLRFSGGQPQS